MESTIQVYYLGFLNSGVGDALWLGLHEKYGIMSHAYLDTFMLKECRARAIIIERKLILESSNLDRLEFILEMFFGEEFKGKYPLIFVRTKNGKFTQVWKDSGRSICLRAGLDEKDVMRLIDQVD